MSLDGVEVITNSSASHFSLRKLDLRLKLIGEATRKCGGVYVYSNIQGTWHVSFISNEVQVGSVVTGMIMFEVATAVHCDNLNMASSAA